jgi:uncharacterized small protein (DUF1192 family)
MSKVVSFKIASLISATVLSAFVLVGTGGAMAQSAPDSENGRYTLSPIPDGMIKLDTRTGAVSTCNNNGTGWACYAVPDERTAYDQEIGRLQADNARSQAEIERLKAELSARAPVAENKTDEALPKSDSLKKAEPKTADGSRKIEIPLPSDQDMNRVMSFVEQAWRRLIEMANRMQKDVNGKI